ncbi:glycerol-3-phosphate dehydrogenase [Aurantiacibacter spongiae]|uniref:Glycerol-3-phosphate dehydrogenase n=1 Tax=Aurantiacibacter spongiae TaxID=2488860 RepID=A0A3N5CZM4_9SPHN|nr:glycerol-3-phosphate dehydrogenase [Aurantiacibacter spongiae]RPF72179.1 glycerol-3-phosphate dehydrogenase [Aurantiacibacter spongiae]
MTATFDIAVIGGGVNGAGVARDAAGRGAKVLLLEADDLASGTSSRSSKLVHGGLRYLEYREFALVREALGERETLWSIAPHIVWPMRFVLPVTRGMRPRWMLRAGLFLYDRLGGKSALPPARPVKLADHPAGAHLAGAPPRGFAYSDCWVDDSRLVVLNAKDAARRGGSVLTRRRVTAARREGASWRIEAGSESFTARAIVNAAGPAADDVALLTGERPAFGIRRVRGSHIVVPRQFDHDFAYILQLPDTRVMFVLPYERDFTLIGTTDADHEGELGDVRASESEIAYLLTGFRRHFDLPLPREKVVQAFAGVRALVADGTGRPEAATRGYRLSLSDPGEGAPMLGIYGGKITSYRAVAQESLDMLAARLDGLAQQHWTGDEPLPGGDFARGGQHLLVRELAAEYPFLSGDDALRIARAYGLDALDWLGGATTRADLGRDFGCGLSEAEVDYLRREEWAQTAEDVLWRRSKLGLRMDAEQRDGLRDYLGG